MKANNPNAKKDFIPTCDRALKPEEQSVLELMQLSAEEEAYIYDLRGLGARVMAAMHLGLGGVRNFIGPDGKTLITLQRDENKAPLVGNKKPWLLEQLTCIPFAVRDEATGELLKGLREDEAKNS